MVLDQMFSLAGKTAFIAGASRGLGLAIAQATAAAGAHTIMAARSKDKLAAAVEELRNASHSAEAQFLDVTDRDSIDAAAAAHDNVDILINVAGMNLRKRFQEYTQEEYDRVMQTNMHGLFVLTQKVGGQMLAREKGGKIVFIGSLLTLKGLPYFTVYAMTKSALGGLTRALAAEWGRHNIQVNCIAPGFILTDLNRAMWQPPEMRQWLQGVQANPNFGTLDDIAALAVFLSSPGSNYITGQVISLDGGNATTAFWPFEP
jgi:NAD(P)-dependent dehydrogenase (short-subunit alcohol dehydrogenase family)